MINQLRADLFTQRHSTGLLVCLVAACGAAGLYTYFQHELALDNLAPASVNGVQGLSDVFLVNLLGALLIGLVVSRPFETKSVHHALLAAGRGAFVASKTVVAALAVVALALPFGAAALMARATEAEFAPSVPTTFALLTASTGPLDAGTVARLVAVVFVAALLYAAELAVCIPLAIVVKRPIVVMAAGFAWTFVADLAVGSAERWEVTEALVGLTPFATDRMPLPDGTAGDLLGTTIVCLAFIALMGALSWLLFRRSDVR